jgi:hypothetical protein
MRWRRYRSIARGLSGTDEKWRHCHGPYTREVEITGTQSFVTGGTEFDGPLGYLVFTYQEERD